jgi:flavorubredoxin
MNTTDQDYSQAIAIAPDIYWVGKRNKLNFETNVYLRIFKGNGKKINMLIDPGPNTDFEEIARKIDTVLAPGENIHFIYINHQDPDVCANVISFEKKYPKAQFICSEDIWRLIKAYNFDKKHAIIIEQFTTGKIRLATGHRLSCVSTPYAHTCGAYALFDHEQSVLFSGDFFAGLTETPDLFADESYWEGVKTFHQIYMPTNQAIRRTVENFRQIDQPIKIIAPQHGKILPEELIDSFLDRIKTLPVGLDLLKQIDQSGDNYIGAFNDILQEISKTISPEIVRNALNSFKSDGSFPDIFTLKNGKIHAFKLSLEESLEYFCRQLLKNVSPEEEKRVKFTIIYTLSYWHITSKNLTLEHKFTKETVSKKTVKKAAEVPTTSLLTDDFPSEMEIDDAFDKLLGQ